MIDAYQSVLTLSGDAKRGVEIFRKHCAACHQLGGVGNEFGPDLTKLAPDRIVPKEILHSMIDPSARIDDKYVSVMFQTE